MSGVGLILFAHGARDPRWAEPFEAVARHIRAQCPALMLRLAFLEFMAPDLRSAAAELCAGGCTRVDILPMFLGTGGHLRNDLPPLVQQLQQRHPGVRWRLHPAISEHETVALAMAQAALALLHDEGPRGGPTP